MRLRFVLLPLSRTMNTCVLLTAVGAAAVLLRVRQFWIGGMPDVYAALRCLRDNEPPGETRSWVRMLTSHGLAIQAADSSGVVRRVTVLMFDVDRSRLAILAADDSGWRRNGDRYSIDLTRYFAANPQLQRAAVNVWAEFDEIFGLRVVAERSGIAEISPKAGEV